tara:strand:+ start:1432 stop:1944 length:513 start_codon:yes stop_codon:yes gene_type:complete
MKTTMKTTMKINKGTGAGGANTNKNGLDWESVTHIHSEMVPKNYFSPKSKRGLFKILKDFKDKDVIAMHGCKQPDECFIDIKNKIIVILEKKFQNKGGSVCEKLQTIDAKLYNFNKMFPSFNVHYVYCLNNWFKTNCYAELDYLDYKNIKYFWGEDENYKKEFCNYLKEL